MSDTPLTKILRESVDPFVTSEAVERCLIAYASLEHALGAAIKERDDYFDTVVKICEKLGYTEEVGKRMEKKTGSKKVSDGIKAFMDERCASEAAENETLRAQIVCMAKIRLSERDALRAQISDLQSATPQDHARVIEEVAKVCWADMRENTRFPARTIARHMRALADKLLKPQPLINADFLEEQIAFRLEEALVDGKIDPESFVTANRKVLRELIDMAISTPQPRKEETVKSTLDPIGWKSCAWWPEDCCPAIGNYSDDNHDSEEAARAVCDLLRKNGFGGDGKFFPIRLEVKPVYVPDPSGAATCTCDPGWWHESCPVHSVKPTEAATPTPPRETTKGKLDVSEAANDIVNVFREDLWDDVAFRKDVESILTRLTGDQATRIAELEADKARFRNVVKKIAESPNWEFGGTFQEWSRVAMKEQP